MSEVNTSEQSAANQETSRPNVLELKPEGIPAQLRELSQLVNWRYDLNKDGVYVKVPYQPNGRKAKSNDPKTWSSFDAVLMPPHDRWKEVRR